MTTDLALALLTKVGELSDIKWQIGQFPANITFPLGTIPAVITFPLGSIEPQAGENTLTLYKDGTRLMRFPFKMTIRTTSEDSTSRSNVIESLYALISDLSDDLPELGDSRECLRVEMTSNTASAATYDDKTEDVYALCDMIWRTL